MTDPTPLGPDALWWRLGRTRLIILFAARALFLQLTHPAIGAAVKDHSRFMQDPWGRLDETAQSLELQIFGGERSIPEGERLRQLHTRIKGTGFSGERYSARNPDAWMWVHMVNFDTLLLWQKLHGKRELGPGKREQLWQEWRQAGLVLGIKDSDMPADLAGFYEYFDEMVEQVLAPNRMSLEFLEFIRLTDVPPPELLPGPIWNALKPLGRTVLHDYTIGTLPPALREKCGFTWGVVEKQRLAVAVRAVNLAAPLVPEKLMEYPIAYDALQAARSHGKALKEQAGQP